MSTVPDLVRIAPFLGLTLDLDPHKVAELVLKVYPDGLPRAGDSRAVLLGEVTASIVVAATRLVELIGQPNRYRVSPSHHCRCPSAMELP